MPDEVEIPEGVDLARLRGYFAEHVPLAGDKPLTADLIAGGRSNLTYSISNGTGTWVLRRPPLGHVLPTAHDMVREYRVLTALAGTGVPVPRTYALCEDLDVNGAPFYVMEKVDGVIYRDGASLAGLDADQARRLSEELVDVLARIHGVEYDRVGLGEFGHPEGFLERQIRRWGQQWQRSKTRELPGVDEIARRLNAALPESGTPTIVHGDYRLDNTMMSTEDPGKIVAVLDWEMSTLGDPLADLGLLILYWGNAGAQVIATGSAIDAQAGYLTSDEIVERYAKQSGRSVDALDWYVVFAFYKLAIIVEGIHARFKMGKTLGEGFDAMGQTVVALIDGALERADRSSIPALRGAAR
jgi:aminoglycoside phosphotransferase (APT) family kinase protein